MAAVGKHGGHFILQVQSNSRRIAMKSCQVCAPGASFCVIRAGVITAPVLPEQKGTMPPFAVDGSGGGEALMSQACDWAALPRRTGAARCPGEAPAVTDHVEQ